MKKQEIINILKNQTCNTCVHSDMGGTKKTCRAHHSKIPKANTCEKWFNWGDYIKENMVMESNK